MVEYLSGNRIQGSSAPDINTSDTPTQDFDFSSQGSWDLNIEGSSSHWDLDNSRLNFETKGASSGSGAHFDLTSVPDKWILRFKVRIDSSQTGYVSAGQGDGLILIGLQSHDTESSNTASAPNTSNQQTYSEAHQQAQFIILFKSNATEGSGRYSFQGKFVSDSNAKQCSSSTSPSCNPVFNNDNIYDDTDYYVEIKKTGTTCQISYGTNSDYTTGRTVGTATGVSGLDGLRYIHVEGVAQNVTYDSYGGGYIDDMKYWATVDEKTTLTNIPANTRYEETDTRKIYRFKESDTLEQLNGSGNKTVFTHSGNEAHYGIKINTGSDLIGKVISKVHFKIKQNENPTTENLVYVRLWRGSSFAHTFGTTDPDNIAIGTYTWYSFGTGGDFSTSSDGNATLQAGDRIVLSWDRDGAYNNTYIHMQYSTTSQYEGTSDSTSTTVSPTQESHWSDNATRDVTFKLEGSSGSVLKTEWVERGTA